MDVITEEINQKSNSMSAHFEIDVLAHVASRISSSPSYAILTPS